MTIEETDHIIEHLLLVISEKEKSSLREYCLQEDNTKAKVLKLIVTSTITKVVVTGKDGLDYANALVRMTYDPCVRRLLSEPPYKITVMDSQKWFTRLRLMRDVNEI